MGQRRRFHSQATARPRESGRFLSLVIALGLAGGAHLLLTPTGRIIEGRAHATDGDSIRIRETRIRLKGIDSPELAQTCYRGRDPYMCGEHARDALLGMILRAQVRCRTAGRDKYKRVLAKCQVDGVDLGARMVALGWAVGYGEYGGEERSARSLRVGLWAGDFDIPRDWRRLHPASP